MSLSGTVSHSCRGSTWHSLLSQAWGMTAASSLSFQTSRMKSGLFSTLSAPPGLFSAVLRNSFLQLPELKRLTLALWPYIQPLLWGSCLGCCCSQDVMRVLGLWHTCQMPFMLPGSSCELWSLSATSRSCGSITGAVFAVLAAVAGLLVPIIVHRNEALAQDYWFCSLNWS